MSKTRFPNGLSPSSFNLKTNPIKGGAAGSHTLTGITTSDTLLSVTMMEFDTDGSISTCADLLSEFSISAANTLSNTGGTDTTDALLLVNWLDVSDY